MHAILRPVLTLSDLQSVEKAFQHVRHELLPRKMSEIGRSLVRMGGETPFPAMSGSNAGANVLKRSVSTDCKSECIRLGIKR